jgi:signal transduction histidine kinase
MRAIAFLSTLHYPVVAFLVVASVVAARTFRARRLFLVAAGWAAHLFYLGWRQVAVAVGGSASTSYLRDAFESPSIQGIATAISAATGLILLYAVRGPASRKHRAPVDVWLGGALATMAIAMLCADALSGRTVFKVPATLTATLLSAIAFISVGRYYHRLHDDVVPTGGVPDLLAVGAFAYVGVQFLYAASIVLAGAGNVTIDRVGLLVGLLAKTAIASGYMQLFVVAARRAERDRIRIDEATSIVGRINHELGTPLAEVMLLSTSLRERLSRGERIFDTLNSLENALNRIAAILDAARELPSLSATATGSYPAQGHTDDDRHPSVVNVNALVQRAVFAVKLTRSERVTWRFQYAGNCFASCVPPELVQVMINVLRNACDALPGGRGTIQIRTANIRADRADRVDSLEFEVRNLVDGPSPKDLIQIVVRDDGEGIPEDRQESVFVEGYTTRAGPGRGFGLAVVKSLVSRAGGQIRFVSPVYRDQPDRPGTEVVITLPRVVNRSGANHNGSSTQRVATAGSLPG